jgi:hypothetical protein
MTLQEATICKQCCLRLRLRVQYQARGTVLKDITKSQNASSRLEKPNYCLPVINSKPSCFGNQETYKFQDDRYTRLLYHLLYVVLYSRYKLTDATKFCASGSKVEISLFFLAADSSTGTGTGSNLISFLKILLRQIQESICCSQLGTCASSPQKLAK